MNKFWNWAEGENGERILRLEGPIDSDNFWGDEITPQTFREELEGGSGDVVVWLNSPGGNVFAAAQIYTMLRDYKGKVTVKIDAIAASAASVVAMAGDQVLMSPVAMLMIHDPMTVAIGNAKDMQKAIDTLNEVKESILNAYIRKSSLSRKKIAAMMSEETWLNAEAALQYGFCDAIIGDDKKREEDPDDPEEAQDPDDPEEEEEAQEPGEGEDDPKKKKTMTNISTWSFAARVTDEKIMEAFRGEATKQETTPEGAFEALCDLLNINKQAFVDYLKGLLSQAEADGPQIGMDGKTADGSVPYALLQARMELLK